VVMIVKKPAVMAAVTQCSLNRLEVHKGNSTR
jgi:hypothetical protein